MRNFHLCRNALAIVMIATATGGLVSCRTTEVVAVHNEHQVHDRGKAAFLYAEDPCIFDARFSCHSTIGYILSYESWSGTAYGDPAQFCDYGCTTFALLWHERSMIINAINAHIDPVCGWAINWINANMYSGRMRYYDLNDGATGDAHWGRNNPNPEEADVHLWSGMFWNPVALTKTLVHEAAHVYFELRTNDPESDERMAEAWATLCYKD